MMIFEMTPPRGVADSASPAASRSLHASQRADTKGATLVESPAALHSPSQISPLAKNSILQNYPSLMVQQGPGSPYNSTSVHMADYFSSPFPSAVPPPTPNSTFVRDERRELASEVSPAVGRSKHSIRSEMSDEVLFDTSPQQSSIRGQSSSRLLTAPIPSPQRGGESSYGRQTNRRVGLELRNSDEDPIPIGPGFVAQPRDVNPSSTGRLSAKESAASTLPPRLDDDDGAAVISERLELQRHRDGLQQIAQQMKLREAQLLRREEDVTRREENLTQRERQVEELWRQYAQRKQDDSNIAAQDASRPKEELSKALETVEEYRAQLREAHKELNMREADLEQLTTDISLERENLVRQKASLDAREAALASEQDDMALDVRRHADKLQASSRLVEEKLRELRVKESELETLRYEWDLKNVEAKQRLAAVAQREDDIKRREVEVQRCFDASRSLEVHAIQVARVAERVKERERALWGVASQMVPNGSKALSLLRAELQEVRSSLQSLGSQLPSILDASSI